MNDQTGYYVITPKKKNKNGLTESGRQRECYTRMDWGRGII